VFCDKSKLLGIVIFVHNLESRGAYRLRNLLYSIRTQKNTVLKPDIIVVDQSNDTSYKEISEYCRKFNACHIYSKLDGMLWNKGLCLNYGIKKLSNEYIACMDVDNILAPNFLQVVEKEIAENKLLICKVWNSPSNLDLTGFKMEDYYSLLNQCELLNMGCANGACQLSTKAWFHKVKGYNESLKMWGGMDNELVQVAKFSNLDVQWMNGKTSIIHQYHITKNFVDEWAKMGREQRQRNVEIYRRICASKKIERGENWGDLIISSTKDYEN